MLSSLFGRSIGQYPTDLFAWEEVLNNNPEFGWIIELGTYKGGMSYYLYAQALARDLRFSTLDIEEPEKHVPRFFQTDILEGYPPHWLFPKVSPGILFCDNGNKVKEVELYKDLINRRSCIAVHDWGTEFMKDDIPLEYRIYMSTEYTVFLMRNDVLNEREVKEGKRFPQFF